MLKKHLKYILIITLMFFCFSYRVSAFFLDTEKDAINKIKEWEEYCEKNNCIIVCSYINKLKKGTYSPIAISYNLSGNGSDAFSIYVYGGRYIVEASETGDMDPFKFIDKKATITQNTKDLLMNKGVCPTKAYAQNDTLIKKICFYSFEMSAPTCPERSRNYIGTSSIYENNLLPAIGKYIEEEYNKKNIATESQLKSKISNKFLNSKDIPQFIINSDMYQGYLKKMGISTAEDNNNGSDSGSEDQNNDRNSNTNTCDEEIASLEGSKYKYVCQYQLSNLYIKHIGTFDKQTEGTSGILTLRFNDKDISYSFSPESSFSKLTGNITEILFENEDDERLFIDSGMCLPIYANVRIENSGYPINLQLSVKSSKLKNAQESINLCNGSQIGKLKDSIEPLEIESCEQLIGDDLVEELNSYMLYVKIAIPIIIIVLGSIDMVRAMLSSSEEDMRKAQKRFLMRLLIGMVLFFIPTIINVLLNIANDVWGIGKGTCIETISANVVK